MCYQVTPKSLEKQFEDEAHEPKEAFKLKRMDSLMPHDYIKETNTKSRIESVLRSDVLFPPTSPPPPLTSLHSNR